EISAVESLDSHLRIWGLPRPDIKEKLSTAYERSAMFSEHTWGTCKNLEGRNAYGIKDFEQYVKTDGTCQFLQKTWDDHADYIRKTAQITGKLAKTEIEQLAASTDLEGKRIAVFNPLLWKRDAWIELPDGGNMLVKDLPPSGYKTISVPSVPSVPSEVSETAILENKFLKVILDRARGGIVSIIDKKSGRELVDKKAKYAFGQYVLERFGRKQCDDYQIACNHLDSIYDSNGRACLGWNIRNDLPKDTQHAESAAAFSTMTVSRGANSQKARLSAQPAGIIESQVVTTITLPNDVPWLEISVQLKDKKPNYAPEAGQLCFPVNADTPQFRIGRLGGVVNPATNFVRGSNRTYGQVDTGAMIAGQDGNGVAICPIDQGIMSFGEKRLPDIDPDYVPATPMARLSIFNNFWTTNFPYWIQGDVSTRVRIWPTIGLETASLVIPALEARNPAMVGFSDGPAGKLPAEQAGLSVSRPCIRLTAFRQTDDGTLLRLWEQTGVSGEVCVTLGAPNSNTASPLTFTSALPVNLRGEKIGDPIPIRDGKFSFKLGAYAPASFILTPKLPASEPMPQ
ncbi:MAG: glycoside hydrolase family 38 C-terminal domain-containing protein, partial [Lentisphaerota bacterium]